MNEVAEEHGSSSAARVGTAHLRSAPSATRGLVAGVCVVAAATALGWFVLGHDSPADVVMVYLLGVVIVAMRFGYVPSLVVAVLSVAAFDFFFVLPYFSFTVSEIRNVLTFGIMLFVAVAISNQTERIRKQAVEARLREGRTTKLYEMSRELSVSRTADEMLRISHRHLRDVFGSDASVLLVGPGGTLEGASTGGDGCELDALEMETAQRLVSSGDPMREGSTESPSSAARILPLRTPAGTIGALVVHRPSPSDRFADPAQRALLDTFASQIALAVERARLADEAQRAQLDVKTERLRNALLSSVSHDFRTPLAVVKGAATALLEGGEALSSERRHEYLETISEEASRLNRLIRNLLDMTSLEAGTLKVKKDWHSLEEVIGVALGRLEERLKGRVVETHLPPDERLIAFDALLIEQVLINLVENATKYSPASTPILINARDVPGGVEVEIADAGPRVPEGDEAQVFEKFYRAAKDGSGMGLGLTICRGIIAAHGGKIWYERRAEGGASFRFVIPSEGQAPLGHLPEPLD